MTMKNLVKYFFLTSLLCNSFVLFAQSSDDDTGGGNLDGEDLPINGALLYLVLAAVLFGLFTIKNYRKRHNIN